MAQRLPFTAGIFTGNGSWNDASGAEGAFTSRFELNQHDGIWTQTTTRDFLKDDGTLLYREHSVTTFQQEENQQMTVRIESDGKSHSGIGYYFGDGCHYDMDLSQSNHLENTYLFDGSGIRLLGSATNNGKYTVWQERLDPEG